MVAMRDMLQHPSRAMEGASDVLRYSARQVRRRPYRAGGIVLLILVVLGFIYVFPELHREARIMRM